MSMGLRYKGGFHSIGQTLYEVEIYEEGYLGSVFGIAFCEEPLEIEWPETDKLEPVQSANATLRLYSDNDRQFTCIRLRPAAYEWMSSATARYTGPARLIPNCTRNHSRTKRITEWK